MSDAVVITDWYVVPEESGSGNAIPLARTGRTDRAVGLSVATAGPAWTWADGGASPAHWHGQRPLSAKGTAYLFDLPRARAQPVPLRLAHPLAPAPERAPAPVVMPMAPSVLRAMSRASATTGRAEGELWAEAAREWLARHHDDDPEPPTPGASASTAMAARDTRPRTWAAIDILMGDLRAPLPSIDDESAA